MATNQFDVGRRIGSQVPLLSHPAAPGAQGTHLQVDGTGGLVLLVLQLVAVADQGDRGQGRELEGCLLLSLIPGKKVCHCLGIFFDGTR